MLIATIAVVLSKKERRTDTDHWKRADTMLAMKYMLAQLFFFLA